MQVVFLGENGDSLFRVETPEVFSVIVNVESSVKDEKNKPIVDPNPCVAIVLGNEIMAFTKKGITLEKCNDVIRDVFSYNGNLNLEEWNLILKMPLNQFNTLLDAKEDKKK